MYKDDYDNKMKILLNDNNVYNKCNKSMLNAIKNKHNSQISVL